MIHILGNANQAQGAIDPRLLLDYRMLNCTNDLSLTRANFKVNFMN